MGNRLGGGDERGTDAGPDRPPSVWRLDLELNELHFISAAATGYCHTADTAQMWNAQHFMLLTPVQRTALQ